MAPLPPNTTATITAIHKDRVDVALTAATVVPIRPLRRFRTRFRWTRLPMALRPWRPWFWRMLWITWGRWAQSWAIMRPPAQLGWPDDVASTCVAFGPLVIVVDHPDRSGPVGGESDR